jgi:NAD(P)-dependent dehydrogenase (short-subunit alcohol dehydrogenase family)
MHPHVHETPDGASRMSSTTTPSPVVLVTGATDGIGAETARALVRSGATVIVHGRSAARIESICTELRRIDAEHVAEPVRADLARLSDVRALGDALGRRTIDVVIHNAGVFMRKRELTADGFETTMAVNHLAPFLLTHLLLAGPHAAELRRIVFVSSMAHEGGEIDADDPGGARKRGWLSRFNPYAVYSASKLANVLTTMELARRLRGRHLTVNALHPGVVSTKLLTQGFGFQGSDSLAEGAATSVKLALDSTLDGTSGRYFAAGREATPSARARDRDLARRLYARTAEVVGVTPLGEPVD